LKILHYIHTMQQLSPVEKYLKAKELNITSWNVLDNDLISWLKTVEHGDKQGTPAWVIAKGRTIGGSEQATVEGRNPYSTVKDLVYGKLGITKMQATVKTQFGNLFEDVLNVYTNKFFHTTIRGDDEFLPGKIPRQTYSPDGIGVVMINKKMLEIRTEYVNIEESAEAPDDSEFNKYDKLLDFPAHWNAADINDLVPAIALFEFKCPYGRLPKGYVPEYYKPQVKAGLDTIQLTSIGIFAEAVIRRCKICDLRNTPVYNQHLYRYDPVNRETPEAIGFITLKLNKKRLTGEHVIQGGGNQSTDLEKIAAEYAKLLENLKFSEIIPRNSSDLPGTLAECGTLDVSNFPEDLFFLITNLFMEKVLTPVYSDVFMCKRNVINETTCQEWLESEYTKIKQKTADDFIVAILPWKMIKLDMMYIKKTDGYLDKYKPKFEEITSLIDECREFPERRPKLFSKFLSEDKVMVKCSW